jgi:hypothetical protein
VDPHQDRVEDEQRIDRLLEKAETCHVCGIGSCFVAAVRRADGCTNVDMTKPNDDGFMRKYLAAWFEAEQIGLIEAAFEQTTSYWNRSKPADATDDDWEIKAQGIARDGAEFGRRFDDPDDRLRAIMSNIVENDGTFVPTDSDD